jgi:hypothetical protein
MANIDSRCSWVYVERDQAETKWECYQVSYLDENQSGGLHQIEAYLTGENGLPATGVTVWHDWPDGRVELITDSSGMARVEIWANGFDPFVNDGPYRIYVDGDSDIVGGMGLPLSRHVCYKCFFRKVSGVGPPPEPSGGVTEARVKALINEALDRGKFN